MAPQLKHLSRRTIFWLVSASITTALFVGALICTSVTHHDPLSEMWDRAVAVAVLISWSAYGSSDSRDGRRETERLRDNRESAAVINTQSLLARVTELSRRVEACEQTTARALDVLSRVEAAVAYLEDWGDSRQTDGYLASRASAVRAAHSDAPKTRPLRVIPAPRTRPRNGA